MKKDVPEFIDRILANLAYDYQHLKERTTVALTSEKLTTEDKIHLEWGLVHLQNSLAEFERDLKRHRKVLEKDAT